MLRGRRYFWRWGGAGSDFLLGFLGENFLFLGGRGLREVTRGCTVVMERTVRRREKNVPIWTVDGQGGSARDEVVLKLR